jgi:hypothetical protein
MSYLNVSPVHIGLMGVHNQLNARQVRATPLGGGRERADCVFKDDSPANGRERNRDIPCSFVFDANTNWAMQRVYLWRWLEEQRQR